MSCLMTFECLIFSQMSLSLLGLSIAVEKSLKIIDISAYSEMKDRYKVIIGTASIELAQKNKMMSFQVSGNSPIASIIHASRV